MQAGIGVRGYRVDVQAGFNWTFYGRRYLLASVWVWRRPCAADANEDAALLRAHRESQASDTVSRLILADKLRERGYLLACRAEYRRLLETDGSPRGGAARCAETARRKLAELDRSTPLPERVTGATDDHRCVWRRVWRMTR